MRIFGWLLGGLLLADGILAIMKKRDLIKTVTHKVGDKLPSPLSRTLRKATDINDTARKAMAINNLLAGMGMLLVSTLTGWHRMKQRV